MKKIKIVENLLLGVEQPQSAYKNYSRDELKVQLKLLDARLNLLYARTTGKSRHLFVPVVLTIVIIL